jgi:site-specific DNA recombinase
MNNKTRSAAIYLRSSKDRSDVSIAAQRRDLQKLATERKLAIVREYTDVVESAKSEHRPGFQALLAGLKSPDRRWGAILFLDTSRLSRRRYVAQVFRHEARKRGVELIFAKVPETDAISQVILESVLEAMDEVHSLMSREKGLAGMAENVRQGFRAGGRAPRGYRLKTVTTGAVRDGQEVAKSVLEPTEDAPLVARYLKARAQGRPRPQIKGELSIPWSYSSLIAMEWNALAYAGHTVWNRHNEVNPGGGYKGGKKMRPRGEWHIKENTHPAVISRDEAEALLDHLEHSIHGEAVSRARRGLSDHLLSGLLRAPDGRLWEGWRQSYRLKRANGDTGRYVRKEAVDHAVVDQIVADMGSDDFIDALYAEAKREARTIEFDTTEPLGRELQQLEAQIDKAMNLALQLDDSAPALRKVNELESRRQALLEEIARVEQEHAVRNVLHSVTRDEVAKLVRTLAVEIDEAERPRLKGVLQAAVEQIMLDPGNLHCRIHYRIAAGRTLDMASPRGFEPLLPP